MSAIVKKPRLLFLSFYFPPLRAVASVRTGNIAKYLSKMGWDVTVVTPNPSMWAVTDELEKTTADIEKYKIKRILTDCKYPYLFPRGHLKDGYSHVRGIKRVSAQIVRSLARIFKIDKMIGWYVEVERTCAYLRPGDIDVVMASGNPYGAFKVAQQLAQRLNCPVVFDYRDLWTGNPQAKGSKKTRDARKESKLLQSCTAVSVVSRSMAVFLEKQFNIKGKVFVIPNGFDGDEYHHVAHHKFDHFAIIYAGSFFPPMSSAELIMKVLHALETRNLTKPFLFHYYGPNVDYVHSVAQQHKCDKYVVLHGNVPHAECLSAIKGSGVAIVIVSEINSTDLGERGVITGKIFEAIGLGTPMMVVAPSGFDVEQIVDTVGNGAVFSSHEISAMADFIIARMEGIELQKGHPEIYGWENIGGQMDRMLRDVVKGEDLNG
jgi:glycosyltransferase involved in cell wall biosynthesis